MNSKRSVLIALGGLVVMGVISLLMRQEQIAMGALTGITTAIGFLIGDKS